MIDHNGLPGAKAFFRNLGKTTHELGELVRHIEKGVREYHLNVEFQRNPHARDANGTLKFSIALESDPSENLLESFSLEEIRAITAGEFVRMTAANGEPVGNLNVDYGYSGRKVLLYPDSNILLNPNTDGFLSLLARHPAIEKDVLTVVGIESQEGGLRRKFHGSIPEAVFRGQQTLEKRCRNVAESLKPDITRFFDIVVEYFTQEYGSLIALSDANRNLSPKDIALSHARRRGKNTRPDYVRMMEKSVEMHRSGNDVNHIADRILATTCFGFNLINPYNKSIVVSNDGDLIALMDIVYDEIMPRYMERTALDVLSQNDPKLLQQPGFADGLLASAKKHLDWGKKHPGMGNIALGILYIPSENKFYVEEVAEPIRKFFSGVQLYREAKINILAQMALTGQSPDYIVQRLIAGNQLFEQQRRQSNI